MTFNNHLLISSGTHVNAEQKSDSLHAESRFTFPTTCGIQFQLKIVACSNLKIDIENS